MIPKLMVNVSILVVAIVALAGLAYQTVPASTTQTILHESTERLVSYSPYMVTNIMTYTSTSIDGSSTWVYIGPDWGDIRNYNCVPGNAIGACFFTTETITSYSTINQPTQSTYEAQRTTAIPYSKTVTSSITESSTSIVPVYSSLGLNDTSFGALSIIVIGVLALVTAWFVLKSKPSHKSRQASISQSLRSKRKASAKVKKAEKVDTGVTRLSMKATSDMRLCTKCGNELFPNLKFCDSCGTKQP